MTYRWLGNGPVVVGGVGGSGTRVVAELLSLFGFFMGNDLNEASDNLLYTLLFKRRNWFYRYHDASHEIHTGLGLFARLMTGEGRPSLPEGFFLLRAVLSMAMHGHNRDGAGKGLWPLERLKRLGAVAEGSASRYLGWGWKEPNSHLLVRQIAEHFPNARYIHTVRHGLDMAFSANQQQLYNWGEFFGVGMPYGPMQQPAASLRYWVRANEQAQRVGEQLGPGRFLLLNFDQLCTAPAAGIDGLIRFLAVSPDDQVYRQALALPRSPSSIGRYRMHDLGQFDASDLAAVERFGFAI